jgi:glycosyltransferase involved in cell wall biosynthesis
MIFNYLKYLKPTWYFNLKSCRDWSYFPDLKKINDQNISVSEDLRYQSQTSVNRDFAWSAFQSGYISMSDNQGLNVWESVTLPIFDEYLFLRKNFHAGWVIYVLFFRIFSFHNPLKELAGFYKTRHVKKIDYSQFQLQNKLPSEIKLPESQPMISVIIPTLNRYDYLKDVLKDLELQTYRNFEVIIVDQTYPFQEDFYKDWQLNLRYWYQEEKALWKARNEAIKASLGDYVLLYDDDSRVDSDWIESHLKSLLFFEADLSSGVSLSVVGDTIPSHYKYFRWSDQLDTGNVLIKKSVFEQVGYFDRQFEKQRMGDGEFGLRCYLNGLRNISNPLAKRIHLKVEQGGLRQMGSWDGWRPKKLFGPRPVPSVLYLSRKYFGSRMTFYNISVSILPSLVPYKWKSNKFLKILSFLMLPFLLPLVFFQVLKSWNQSSSKLQEGFKP